MQPEKAIPTFLKWRELINVHDAYNLFVEWSEPKCYYLSKKKKKKKIIRNHPILEVKNQYKT